MKKITLYGKVIGPGFSRISQSREQAKLTLESIEIQTPPTKTEYTEGEQFNKTGMVIIAKYSDDSKKTITDYTYSPTEELKESDAIITISYTENGVTKTVNQTIKVNKAQDKPTGTTKTLNSIEVTKAPNKTIYKVGEKFDKSGMVITAKYSDNTTKVITDYTFSPTGTLKGSDTTVTITYTEDGITKTASLTIKVTDTTTATKVMPNTGKVLLAWIIGIVIISGTVAYVRYKKLYIK